MTIAFPWLMKLARVLEPKFVSHCQPDFAAFQLRETEPSHTLLVETQVPAHRDVSLRLRLLQPLVVVCLDFHEGPKDVLVLISVLVAQDNGLRFIIYSGLLQIFKRGVRVLAPQVLETVDLLERDLSGTQLLCLARRLDEPREERAVVDQRCPEGGIP